MHLSPFITRLAAQKAPPHCVNPYHISGGRWAHRRRHNLERYLTIMAAQQPAMMLVGEAPGYRGARLTGIPFASPALLETAVTPTLFGPENGFHPVPEWPHIRREASATIMWETLQRARGDKVPLLWNAFPFHPHPPADQQSNRTPTRSELTLGRSFLQELHELFNAPPLVAVGRKAAHSLQRWGLPFTAVRHPSHGGKAAFQAGLQQLWG